MYCHRHVEEICNKDVKSKREKQAREKVTEEEEKHEEDKEDSNFKPSSSLPLISHHHHHHPCYHPTSPTLHMTLINNCLMTNTFSLAPLMNTSPLPSLEPHSPPMSMTVNKLTLTLSTPFTSFVKPWSSGWFWGL